MKCKICNSPSDKVHRAIILRKYEVQYFQCPECGFVQTETPYWINEAYSSPLSASDTGILSRNLYFADLTAIALRLLCISSDKFLDFGGGYGVFVRLMRDRGFDFYWYDKYSDNLMARGFEGTLTDVGYGAATSFENFEHFEDPLKEIETLSNISDTILFSTTLIAEKAPPPTEWWYYCLEHGQHISFYSRKTLLYISKLFNLSLVSDGAGIHILSKRKISAGFLALLKIFRRCGMGSLFNLPSKTIDDMNFVIAGGNKP